MAESSCLAGPASQGTRSGVGAPFESGSKGSVRTPAGIGSLRVSCLRPCSCVEGNRPNGVLAALSRYVHKTFKSKLIVKQALIG